MKVAAVIVGTDTQRFRTSGANAVRIELAHRIAHFVEAERADLCVMPAGYLAATSGYTVPETAGQLASCFKRVDLIAGVDAAGSAWAKREARRHNGASADRRSKPPRGGWPFWGFVSRRGRVNAIYQQRTIRRGDKTDDLTARIAEITGIRVGLLICGELYCAALAASLGDERADLVVNIGHRSMGRNFTATLPNAAVAAGCRVLHAQHVALPSRGASKWMSTTQQAWAETDADWTSYAAGGVRDALWAEVKLWEVEGSRSARLR